MILQGKPVSKGAAVGKVFVYRPFSIEVKETFIAKEAVKAERERYAAVLSKAEAEITDIQNSLQTEDPEQAKIFSAHLDILHDPAVDEEVAEGIETELWSGDWAVWQVYAKFIKMILKAKDPMIRERSADFEDVRSRILRIWHGKQEQNLSSLSAPVIIAAKDLLPSDTATLDRKNVLAIVTEVGGETSHSAIIARSYEIPAVLGIANLLETVKDGSTIAVDALTGEVFGEPDKAVTDRITAKRERHLAQAAEVKAFLRSDPRTACGTRIDIGLNIADANEEELSASEYTDFVGLFRTEFLYMGKSELPTEDEQFEVYRNVLTRYGEKPVTLRTLDIGGDKTLTSMDLPKEENPFLGRRALRLCFSFPDMFKTQLRAALRASVYGNLNLMLPMVGSMDDIRRARSILNEVQSELSSKGIAWNRDFKFGVMIEIPSIALISDLAAREIDFASIGTNDLCQYLTAVDRMNSDVSAYYQNFHPAMFRLIGHTAESFNAAGKPLGVCGEMGGNPEAAAVLVGLGLRKLSMGLASVAPVKAMLSKLSIPKAEEIAAKVKNCATAGEAENFIREQLALCGHAAQDT